MADSYVTLISDIVAHYGYWLILCGLFLENAAFLGVIFPGMTLLLMGGYYAGLGQLNPYWVFFAGFIGTILGDNTSYFIGRHGILQVPFLKKFERYLTKLEKLIHDRTEFFLMLYHFSAYGRLLIPSFLGTIKFPFRQWVTLDTFGAILFVGLHVFIGYQVGKAAAELDELFHLIRYIQTAFLVLFMWWVGYVCWNIIKIHRKRRSQGERAVL